MIKKIFSLLLLISPSSIIVSAAKQESTFFRSLTDSNEVPEADKLMSKIIDQTAQEISKKYNFLPFGVGLSGKFQGVGLTFRVFRPLDKTEARKVLFECADLLLENINKSKEIRSHLETFPFTLDNVGITLYFSDENYNRFSHPHLAVAKIGDFGLLFRTAEGGQSIGYKEESEETIEEARAILNKSTLQ